MLIECTLKREEPVVVSISGETYTFAPDEQGRRVADVWREDHINQFLAVSHLYREAKGAADVPPDDPHRPPLKRREIMAALKARGIKFAAQATNDALLALLGQRAA